MFITLHDETDIANLIVWLSVFDRLRRAVRVSQIMTCRGRVQRSSGIIHVIAEHLTDETELLNSVGGQNEAFTLTGRPRRPGPPLWSAPA
ncbi:hypothetical protein MA20_47740 [Bradyrhizobium japonicum]|uniref:OB domain-containing protein n=2 Tax=Bradyrhizobium japonicum TaxID=375 RepID=A0A0A3YGQ7_BRAJP|nr:hypothetical protein MA20_47740 [Bradyrhizobium japonicum]